MGCIYSNHQRHPAGRGYGYVAVSRFRSRGGCFLYGKLRRTDFLLAGEGQPEEVTERGYQSVSDDSENYSGMDYAFHGGDSALYDTESEEGVGHALGDGTSGLENAFQDGICGMFVDSDADDNMGEDRVEFL